MTDKKLTDNEIIEALEKRIKDLPCIHKRYEPACGMWCEHLHTWCIDFNNNSLKENCSEYKPCCSMSLEKQVLDFINRQKAEIERLKKEEDENFKKWNMLAEKTKEHYSTLYEEAKEILKSEAVKEFAERLKEDSIATFSWKGVVLVEEIDNLLKEFE